MQIELTPSEAFAVRQMILEQKRNLVQYEERGSTTLTAACNLLTELADKFKEPVDADNF